MSFLILRGKKVPVRPSCPVVANAERSLDAAGCKKSCDHNDVEKVPVTWGGLGRIKGDFDPTFGASCVIQGVRNVEARS